jgi:hypothetical protein
VDALLKDDADHLRKAQQVRPFVHPSVHTDMSVCLIYPVSHIYPFHHNQTQDLLGNKAGRAKSRFQRRREMMIEETGDFDPIYGSVTCLLVLFVLCVAGEIAVVLPSLCCVVLCCFPFDN